MAESKFPLGMVVSTPNALDTLVAEDLHAAIQRHHCGDWGDVDPHDRKENERALKQGNRLFSVYHDRAKTKFWIITEADRSSTTVLLPEDY